MFHPIDPRTGEFLWHCPQCKEYIRFYSLSAMELAERAGKCQGCRAKAAFEKNPELIGYFLYFWNRSNAWPQSHSWMEAIPITA
jgi:hypothetical protein